jgi:hypothetical protein
VDIGVRLARRRHGGVPGDELRGGGPLAGALLDQPTIS